MGKWLFCTRMSHICHVTAACLLLPHYAAIANSVGIIVARDRRKCDNARIAITHSQYTALNTFLKRQYMKCQYRATFDQSAANTYRLISAANNSNFFIASEMFVRNCFDKWSSVQGQSTNHHLLHYDEISS